MPSFLKTFPISYTFSKPPTISCFKNNSGAILNSKFCFSSFDCVKKGFARAPPACALRIGVSTSRKPLSSRYLRRNLIIYVLLKKNCLSSLFTIKSRYLYLKRFSESFRVFLWFQFIIGRFLSQLESSWRSLAITVNSPASVRPG